MTRLDRRALFTSGAAAALLAASGLSAEARPGRGGRLRLALAREGDSLNRLARGAMFDTLTEVAPDGVLRAGLASSWQGSPDARRWEFSVRPDVSFHGGRIVSATDVQQSLLANGGLAEKLVQADVTGPLTLRLTLAAGNPDFPYLLSDSAFMITNAQGVGSGLYAPQRMQEGRHFLGQRVVRHFKDGQAGWVDSVDAIVIPDAAVRAEALRDGFVDIAELPARDGLVGREDFVFHPSAENMALAARRGVGIPRHVGSRTSLDDGRLAERWWLS